MRPPQKRKTPKTEMWGTPALRCQRDKELTKESMLE